VQPHDQERHVSDSGQTQRGGSARDRDEAEVEETTAAATDEDAKDVVDDVDELLEEIDDVLEENAEEFVRNYVQKGGQ
jgi:ubiquitin-like protein Pup